MNMKTKVLIIDDDAMIRGALTRLLIKRGFGVIECTPDQALTALTVQSYDAVVMDYTGHPVPMWVRLAKTAPVIVWTGEICDDLPGTDGVYGVCRKPEDPVELLIGLRVERFGGL